MSKHAKLLDRILFGTADANIPFDGLCHLLQKLGFQMRAGGNDIKMADIIDGRFCGACHNNQIAWGVENCNLCHSALPGSKTRVDNRGQTTKGPGKL